jgi:hypothetical protein
MRHTSANAARSPSNAAETRASLSFSCLVLLVFIIFSWKHTAPPECLQLGSDKGLKAQLVEGPVFHFLLLTEIPVGGWL